MMQAFRLFCDYQKYTDVCRVKFVLAFIETELRSSHYFCYNYI